MKVASELRQLVPIRAHAVFLGKVQGVFFRATTQRQAQALNLTGWVRNLDNGSVEAVIEGEQDAVEQLLAFCKNGIPRAKVDQVKVDWSDAVGDFRTFEITK